MKPLGALMVAVVGMLLLVTPAASAQTPSLERAPLSDASNRSTEVPQRGEWSWPVSQTRQVVEPFVAPAHAYGPGHRGTDIAAPPGSIVLSPARGVVAFRGRVVDRMLLTVDHGDALISTFEPLDSSLSPGDVVERGDVLGAVSEGGHSPDGSLHVGVRWHGEYINPMLMFGGVPRAVLLPCCKGVRR